MIDYQSLVYALSDTLAVLAFALPLVFVLDALVYSAIDCTKGE